MTRIAIAILQTVVGLGISLARADVIVTPVVSPMSGSELLTYTLSNNGGTNIIGFAIYTDTNDLILGSPTGWISDIFTVANVFQIQWASDGSNDLLPSARLAGFSVLTHEAVGAVQYSYLDSNFDQHQGTALGPIMSAQAPEPSCLTALGIVTLIAGGWVIGRLRLCHITSNAHS